MESAIEEWDNVAEVVPNIKINDDEVGEKSLKSSQSLETPLMSVNSAIDLCIQNARECPSIVEVKHRLLQNSILSRLLCHHCSGFLLPREDIICDIKWVMALAKTPYDDEQSHHFTILLTLYKQFTGSKFDCVRFGSHWEQIGFQGNDPATDLRGVGILGLLHPLFLVTTSELVPFAKSVMKTSQNESQEFPFMVLSLNLTKIVYSALLEGLLNPFIKDDPSLWFEFNFFYGALLFHFISIWRKGHKTIKDSGFVLKDCERACHVRISRIRDEFVQHLQTYSLEEKQRAKEDLRQRLKTDWTTNETSHGCFNIVK